MPKRVLIQTASLRLCEIVKLRGLKFIIFCLVWIRRACIFCIAWWEIITPVLGCLLFNSSEQIYLNLCSNLLSSQSFLTYPEHDSGPEQNLVAWKSLKMRRQFTSRNSIQSNSPMWKLVIQELQIYLKFSILGLTGLDLGSTIQLS